MPNNSDKKIETFFLFTFFDFDDYNSFNQKKNFFLNFIYTFS